MHPAILVLLLLIAACAPERRSDRSPGRTCEPCGDQCCGRGTECLDGECVACGGDECAPEECVPATCALPPEGICVDENTARVFGAGICRASGCVYTASDTPCPNGCREGACLPTGPCEYRAHQAWTLSNLANAINEDLAEGWKVHSIHARPENNNGSAQANVVWMQRGGGYFALQHMTPSTLATNVTNEVAAGARVQSIHARPHGSSVAPEVAWLERDGAYRAHQASSVSKLATSANSDLADGWRIHSFHARAENNSGSAQANVVWLLRGGSVFARQHMTPSTLAGEVTGEVAAAASVHTIAARPHGSSVAPEVVWLERAGEYRAHQAWSLGNLAKALNPDVADGWRVHSFHAREENNSGSAQANVAWLEQGGTYFALQHMTPSALASNVTSAVAEGARVHSVHARPHGSSVPPEVAWMERCP